MKVYLHLTFLIILLNLFSCKEPTKETKVVKTEKKTEIKKVDSISTNSKTKTKEIAPQKHYKYFFVSAKSGLNYRNKPKGKVLGKFHLNTQLKVIDYPKIINQVTEKNKVLKGEWLGIEKEMDTVYVFSGFLSESYTYSEIQLFYTSPYYKTENELRQGFVNLSELYPFDYESYTNTIIPEEKLGKEPIKFNQSQTNRILDRIGISKRDTLYIFNLDKDFIYRFQIKKLKTIAYLNPYTQGGNNTKEYEYMIGLDLGEKYKEKGNNFSYIGKTNPFQTGKIKPMVWNKTENANFPIKETSASDNTTLETFTLSLLKFKYFIQSHIFHKNKRSRIRRYHLVIKDTTTNEITTELNYNSSESIYLSSIHTSDKEMEYHYSWTGELFKNKPPIIYGLYSNSFGCQSIDFIYKNEPPIPILCDNRH